MNILYIIVAICALIGAIAQILLKIGVGKAESLVGYVNWFVAAGLFCYGIAMVGYLFALKKGEVSRLYSIIALSYAFVLFLSWWVLQESMSVWKIAGVSLIIVGITLVTH